MKLSHNLQVFRAAMKMEWAQLCANRAFVILSALAAISLIVMVSLFGLTGSYAPVAVINQDHGPFSRRILEAMDHAYHSFALKFPPPETAEAELMSGRLVGILTIPNDFTAKIEHGETANLDMRVDNLNVDLTNDVQRALPAAIVANGRNFPGVRVQMEEHDVWPHDTSYISYLVVSGLALDAMLIAGILGALITAREWENQTLKMLRMTPASFAAMLLGRLVVAASAAAFALMVALLVIVQIYNVVPASLSSVLLALSLCVIIFVCLGACLGVLLKRTLTVVPLMFGLVMPFYVASGALEPARFDGEVIWRLAHLSPVYYAVGLLEWAFHGLHVTPEPIYMDLLILLALALGSILLALNRLSRGRVR